VSVFTPWPVPRAEDDVKAEVWELLAAGACWAVGMHVVPPATSRCYRDQLLKKDTQSESRSRVQASSSSFSDCHKGGEGDVVSGQIPSHKEKKIY